MKRTTLTLILILTGLFCATSAFASAGKGKAHWGYTGAEGPEFWGSLSHDFVMCGYGKNQSPVNLTGMVEGELPELQMDYDDDGTVVINNGHSIQVNYAPGNTLTFAGVDYELRQFHFHAPSENTIEGKSFPLEAHFVHLDENGNIAVVALMFVEGNKNEELEKIWADMPAEAHKAAHLGDDVDASILLPENHDYYYFNGSLTTPPCTEGVHWFVMKNYATASKEQIEKFKHIMHHPNNRPVQPLNARKVIQ